MAEKITDTARIGAMGEAAAERYLNQKGFHTLQRNYRIRGGEIDIIAANEEYIVFAEVKTRNTRALERPAFWVDSRKQRRILRTAMQYMVQHDIQLQPRCDVIEVEYDAVTKMIVRIEHIENAFVETDNNKPY